MKRVLILVLSSQKHPYGEMVKTSLNTWDSVEVGGVETVYYFGEPSKQNTDKFIYFPIREDYSTMGHKMLNAFEWVLNNKEFDYIARVNSSCYVDKKKLIKYVQNVDNEKLFAGVEIIDTNNWCWGGMQFLISKDVIKSIVENKNLYNHSLMEDMALSFLVKTLGYEFAKGIGSSIDKVGDNWRLTQYNDGESFEFTDFNEVRKSNQFFFRVKQDGQRQLDKYLMEQLFSVLK